MENVIEFTSGEIPEEKADKPPVEITEIFVDGEAVDAAPEEKIPEEYTHIRSPELHKNAPKILMCAVALIGTAAGVLATVTGAFGEKPTAAMSENLSAGFWSVFSKDFLRNAACLLAELLLGFFALGDLFVWIVPLFLGLGTGLACAAFWNAALLPSAAAVILCGSFGAAFSSSFSEELRSFTTGKNRRPSENPAKSYIAKFFALLIGITLAALYKGVIAEFALSVPPAV